MKLELLQSASVAVMILGLFLAATGAYGAYFFGAKGDRLQKQRTAEVVEMVDSRVMDLLGKQIAVEQRLAAIEEQANTRASATVASKPAPPPTVTVPVSRDEPAPPPSTLARVLPPLFPAPAAEALPAIAQGPAQAMLAPTPTPRLQPPKPHLQPPTVAVRPPEKTAVERPPSEIVAALGVTDAQWAKMVRRLRGYARGSVGIHVREGQPAAVAFAEALRKTFVTAGWKVAGVKRVKKPHGMQGITLSAATFPPPIEVTTAFSAMVSGGLKLTTDLDPNQATERAVIFIGSLP